jgi:hypothetical protein
MLPLPTMWHFIQSQMAKGQAFKNNRVWQRTGTRGQMGMSTLQLWLCSEGMEKTQQEYLLQDHKQAEGGESGSHCMKQHAVPNDRTKYVHSYSNVRVRDSFAPWTWAKF